MLAAALSACGGSGGAEPAGGTVAQPPLTSAQPPAASAATSTAATTTTATTPATATQPPATSTQPATQPATSTSTAASGGAPAGCPSAVGGFIRNVQARGTDCGRARDVAGAWFEAVHGGADPTSQVTAAGYACSASMVGERASVSCAGSGGAVTFTASP